MKQLVSHMLVAPIVLPLMTAGLLLLLDDRRKRAKALINILASALGLFVAANILSSVHGEPGGNIGVYLASNWQAPFGIVLVADRLSALMLVLVGIIGTCVALYAEAAWARAGVYFRPLFQIQLMGLNGAFLTGDLFNLFVFFEVMLAASYGLQLHGSGWPRVRSGLHYIATNLLASSFFLIGLSVLYGVVGTLSMADIASKLELVPARDRGLLHAAAAILATAFLIKAAIWPLNAWLVPAYSAASAPVAAVFALMTKVGIYVLLRLWTLLFPAGASQSAEFGGPVLLYSGLATLAFGAIGLVASMRLGRIASFSIIVSSGTLLAAFGTGNAALTSAALFYLISATLAVSVLFLLVELIERTEIDGQPRAPAVSIPPGEDTNLDDEELPLVGRAFPVSTALPGLAFVVCTLLIAGLPPFSGFLAKVSLMAAATSSGPDTVLSNWVLFGLLLLSSLTATLSLSRAGIRHFWAPASRLVPHLKSTEGLAVAAILFCCVWLSVFAESVMQYTSATAAQLHTPSVYIESVLSKKPVLREASP